jgi:formate--tetrahydrofolate ligase
MLRPISQVAAAAGLRADELRLYGPHIAKVSLEALERRLAAPAGRVVLVTSINPTPTGEGKTVTAIALGQALHALGARPVVCLRQPSMGPVFGLKGGATGGGRCTVEPADEINLHFTGDFHAVTAATNLLAAVLDDHIYRDRAPRPDVRRPMLHRVLDVNDRALRRVVVGLGGVAREEQFDITAASEVMAVLGLATDYADLRGRLGRMIAAVTREGARITADDLHAGGAMAALLRDALQPNLVQTQEGCPAFVHTGPFANIAHGTSSLISLRLAQRLGHWAVIEAGFGADLGAEKFVHIVGGHGGPHPDVAVVVVTVRALKYHGGVPLEELASPRAQAVAAGLPQLDHHVAVVRRLHMSPVVCINAFSTDSEEEVRVIADAARRARVPVAVSRAYTEGGAGARELAELVQAAVRHPVQPAGGLYDPGARPEEKLRVIAQQVYGAAGVTLADAARRHLDEVETWGYGRLPVCVAKTQYSLSDQAHVRGVPAGVVIHIRDAEVRAGAGFILALAGEMMTMPALPSHPRAWDVDLDAGGVVRGL